MAQGVGAVDGVRVRRLKLAPCAGRLSSPWGTRIHPVTGQRSHHNGQDWAVPTGTPLVAADDGVVDFILRDSGEPSKTTTTPSGNAVGMKRSDGVKWSYSHMSRIDVTRGQVLKAGDVVGLSGNTGRSTGPHLHFVVRRPDGTDVDPKTMLPSSGGGALPLALIVGAIAALV